MAALKEIVLNNKSAEKRQRQNEAHRMRNKAIKHRVRTEIKKYLVSLESGSLEEAEGRFVAAVKVMDSARGKGVFHKNTVSRKKSRLARRLNALRVSTETASG